MQPVRFGLIGFGAWGRHHAEAIVKTSDARLVAITARSEGTANAARDAFPQAATYTDYRRLLDRDDIDVIDIVLPSHLHHEVAAAALGSGRHVLLEKPMCLSLDDCDDLIGIARRQNVRLAIGHELRLSSLWGRVNEMIDAGFVGDPHYVLVELSRNPYRQGADGWRYDISRVGNWILEEPIHFFDLARWYLKSAGDPVSVYATANSRQADHPELQDNFSAILKTSGGAYAVVTQTLAAFEHHQTVKVTGSKGALWASWSGAIDRTRHPTFSLRVFDGGEVQSVPVERAAGELFELEDQIAMLVRSIQHDGPVACTAEDGRWSVALCLAAQRSVDAGTAIEVGTAEARA
ncbi:MAG: Gfo/Idh/MocA family oxidoreductase [Planctomycetota bacterium]|nr:Gfo/Idh/MocA family oxidoreductase [Planctomycetaceae bacterium]MDQ3330473.1 Gfo/Idh/MocA family oxidoreductase [Planctomycetota bacterium]